MLISSLVLLASLNTMMGWTVNLIPQTVQVYADKDGDRKPDEVWVYPIIAGAESKCNKKPHVDDDLYIFTTCNDWNGTTEHGYIYWTTRKGWLCHSCLEPGFTPVWTDITAGMGLDD